MSDNELRIVLDGERPPSTNTFYAGVHWSKRKEIVDRIHALMIITLRGAPARITKLVDIDIVAYFEKRPLDSPNICQKAYIDGMVMAGLLVNDTRQYVRRVSTQSEIDKDRPRVEIVVRELAA